MKTALLVAGVFANALAAEYNYIDPSAGPWAEGTCSKDENKRQSPVNLMESLADADSAATCDDAEIFHTFEQNKSGIEYNLANNGHTLQADGNWSTMYVYIDGMKVKYNALQFHFHAPSEHTIKGESHDLEMHIVHELDAEFDNKKFDQYAVQGFFFDSDTTGNNLFEESEDGLDVAAPCLTDDCPAEGADTLNFSTIGLNKPETVVHYKGGFTTPPCTGIASWFISTEVGTISEGALADFTGLWADENTFAEGNGNNRPTQGDITPIVVKSGCEMPANKEEDTDDEDSESVSRLIASASLALAMLALVL